MKRLGSVYVACTHGVQRSVMVALLALLWLAALPALAAERTVLVMGDSLSAAYGLAPEQGWVALLADRLRDRTDPRQVFLARLGGFEPEELHPADLSQTCGHFQRTYLSPVFLDHSGVLPAFCLILDCSFIPHLLRI